MKALSLIACGFRALLCALLGHHPIALGSIREDKQSTVFEPFTCARCSRGLSWGPTGWETLS